MKKGNRNIGHSAEFRSLFVDLVKDIYWAEKHLAKGMRKMAKAAANPELAAAFAGLVEESKGQIERLEEVFGLLGRRPQGKRCEAMAGLVAEAEEAVENTPAGTFARDAGLIMAAQKAGHYEIATYGTLRYFAEVMGEKEIAKVLGATLKEERRADDLLSYLTDVRAYEAVAAE